MIEGMFFTEEKKDNSIVNIIFPPSFTLLLQFDLIKKYSLFGRLCFRYKAFGAALSFGRCVQMEYTSTRQWKKLK